MQKVNEQFRGNFSFNGDFPVEMFQQFPQLEQFYIQRQKAAAEVHAENRSPKSPKNRYAFSFRSKADTTDNARLKNREKQSPVIAYLYGQQPRLREDLQIAQEQIQIILEDNHIRMIQRNQDPDSTQTQSHTPPPPKRLKRLEVIRL